MTINAHSNEDINIVEMLRVKTEEADLDSYLKSSFGGYTKKSVLDYLAVQRKQQQTMAEKFNTNLQALLEEKENLKKSNEFLQTKLLKTEAEYKNLYESTQIARIECQDDSVDDVSALKISMSGITEELKRVKLLKDQLEQKIIQLENTNQCLVNKLEHSKQEIEAQKEMVIAEKLEAKKQRDLVVQLSNLLENKQDELTYWKGMQYEGQTAELNAKIEELTEQLNVQKELIGRQNDENLYKEHQMENLTAQVNLQKNTIESLTIALNNTNLQNEKVIYSNKLLAEQIENDTKKTILLIQEKSDASIEKIIAEKNLSDANSRISMLEQKINQCEKAIKK